MNNNFDYQAIPDRFTSQGNMPDRMTSLAAAAIPERYQTSANILHSAGVLAAGQNVERVTTQAMIGQEKAVYKEIAKGIILHKVQVPLVGAGDGAEVKYVFKVTKSLSFYTLVDTIVFNQGNRLCGRFFRLREH